MNGAVITSPIGTLCIITLIAGSWFFFEQRFRWRLFQWMPPLLLIYASGVLCSNFGLIASDSAVYDWMQELILPTFMTLLLVSTDFRAAVRGLGRGVIAMLAGTAGVVVGGPVAYFLVRAWLPPEAWRGFGVLAGSWIGGSGNMAATAAALETPEDLFGLAILADSAVYLIWIPILIQSKAFASRFSKWARTENRFAETAPAALDRDESAPTEMHHYLFLFAICMCVAFVAEMVASRLPPFPPVFSESTYEVLAITTLGILLSFTPAQRIAGSQALAMALLYLFVAQMGAKAIFSGVNAETAGFIAGAFVWIVVHGGFVLAAARLLRIDVHIAAISSAANVGGAASAPVVAAYHDKRLVPASILMAMLGYAVGNYAALFTAFLCSLL